MSKAKKKKKKEEEEKKKTRHMQSLYRRRPFSAFLIKMFIRTATKKSASAKTVYF